MKKQFVYRGICAICLLACLGLVWLGAGDGIRPGETAGGEVREKRHMPAEHRDALERQILKAFSPWVVEVEKVSWEREELVDRMRELMEQWPDSPYAVTGYIQVLAEPSGRGSLREYAVIHQGSKQYTFLVTDDGIYQIYSEARHMPLKPNWQEYMRELLQSVPQWQITEEEAEQYVHSFDLNEETPLYGLYYKDDDRLSVWYDGMKFLFTERGKLLECQSSMDEPEKGSLRIRFWNANENLERELQLCAMEMPVYDTYEEWREYLQSLHPELLRCYFFTYTAGEYCADPFIMLETEEAQYGYFQWGGRWYQICFDIPGDGDYFDLELRNICRKLRYDYMLPSYWWCMDEKGNTIEADLMQDVYWLVEEISPGQVFSFECTMVRTQENGIWDEKVYQVAVTALGEETPFQVFEVESSRGNEYEFSLWDFDNAFYFVDFNMDGYRDLESLYYYGASGGSVITFVWSPSRGEFVRMPEEMGNWDYRVYPQTRRMNLHYHGSASSGADELYQWSGEMDYEMIRYKEYSYEDVFDDLEIINELYYIKIISFDHGRETVLSDYTYEEDDENANYVYLFYYLDIAWEKEVVVKGQDDPCILRYVQIKDALDEDGQGEVYLDCLFLSREDTYLICTLFPEQEAPAAYSDIAWEEEAGQLVVSYEDGSQRRYQWDGTMFHVLMSDDDGQAQ